MAKKKSKEQLENFTGGFLRIPHAVFDSNAFKGATDRARSLLIAIARQINGKNNGRLQLTDKWLASVGYTSNGLNDKAKKELIERGLIIQTRHGGLNAGWNWYAVTWLPISDFSQLDLSAASYRQGAWSHCTLPPTKRRQPPKKEKSQARQPGQQKQKKSADHRGSTTPIVGAATQLTAPVDGAKKAVFDHFATPTTGGYVSIPSPPRLVGGVG